MRDYCTFLSYYFIFAGNLINVYSEKAKTGLKGEFAVYSSLLKEGKNCFITMGNAKAVDIIIISPNKKAFYIDIKTTSTRQKNIHRNCCNNKEKEDYTEKEIGRWQLSIKPFWEIHKRNTNRLREKKGTFADFYVFHNLNNPDKNIIVSKEELKKIMETRINKHFEEDRRRKSLLKKLICNWDLCDYCFNEIPKYNTYKNLP
ncbi:MAG: hypothetical protein L6Q66_07000 [Bacteroidia bacterium]|nr:hypothetical protein [Bacteroidia bacterium]